MSSAENRSCLGRFARQVSKPACKMPFVQLRCRLTKAREWLGWTRRASSDASSRPHHFTLPIVHTTVPQHLNDCYTYEIMPEIMEEVEMDMQEIEQETPPEGVFVAPSIHREDDLAGKSYSHFSDIPKQIADDMAKEVVLGVDEAGRGPVLGMPLLRSLP
jgi:hypothetical protein